MTIHVDAVVYYKIYDPVISITNIINVGVGTRLLAQTQLRNVMGAHSLADAMTQRDLMATQLKVCCVGCKYHLVLFGSSASLSFRRIWTVQLILGG